MQKPFEKYGKTLIEHVNISVEPGEHIAIVGDNGVGKTSLLNEIFKKYEDNAYLMKQDMTVYHDIIAMDYIMSLYPECLTIKKAMQHNYERIADYIALNGYEIEQRILTKAKQFNLTEHDLNQSIGLLSGGQQTKVALLRAVISDKELILLDEPTNHLDQAMLADLVQYMNKSNHTLIYVTHHRGFMNETASHIIEITNQYTRKFIGNYNQYKEIIDLEFQTQVRAYEKHQKEIKELEQTISRVKEWHYTAKQSTSVRDPIEQKRLSKLAQKSKIKETQLTQKRNDTNFEEPEMDDRHFHFNDQDVLRKRNVLRIEHFRWKWEVIVD
ncbi:ATP-binding cassette domain-containing protein [Staphylococcus succinus]|uniref:ATP-binding cassette domain-containing protein n=1 Tax=Staphylococcus succinus TaxID=61015 RepID=UPI003F56307C